MSPYRMTFEAQRNNLEWFWSSVKAFQDHHEKWIQSLLETPGVPMDEKAKAHMKRWMKIIRKGYTQAKDSGSALMKAMESRIP